MEEDFILFKKLKDRPVRNCVDLSKNMVGKKNGFIYFTESFRIDFENKMYKLAKIEEELDKKDRVIDEMAKHIGEYGLVCGNCINVECIGKKQKNCIKKYFYKKVEEEYDNR